MDDVSRPYTAHIPVFRPEYVHVGDANGKPTTGSSASNNGSTSGSGTETGNKNPNKWNVEGSENEGQL
jgi:hypothetical protein